MLDNLQQWQLGEQWLQNRLAGDPPEQLVRRLRRSGQLPGGRLGQSTLEGVRRKAETVFQAAQSLGIAGPAAWLPIRLPVAGVLLVGRVEGYTPQGLLRATYGNVGLDRLPRLWLEHLLLTATAGQPLGPAVLVGRHGQQLQLAAVTPDVALEQLQHLVRLYHIGRQVPLPFFRDAVAKVLKELRDNGPDLDSPRRVERLLYLARYAYEENYPGSPAAKLPAVRLAFAGRDPFEMRCADTPGLEEAGDRLLFLHLIETICLPMLPFLPTPDDEES